jgi:hypothetical protein
MSSSHFSALLQGTEAFRPGAQRTAVFSTPSQSNQEFWRDVFDHAKGVGVHEQPQQLDDRGRQSGPEVRQSNAAGPQPDAAPRQGGRSSSASQFMLISSVSPQSEFVGTGVIASPALFSGGLFLPIPQAAGAAVAEADASGSALREQAREVGQGPAGASVSPEADAALHAHVSRTAAGDWKVTLRANKGMSVAQALAAAAQATQHSAGAAPGQIKQVVLNGRPIYQQTSQAEAEPSASCSFELRC